MKVKFVFIVLLSVLIMISISQIFNVPPYAEDMFPVYKSGYFNELERGFSIITDSFLGIKSMARPEYAWIFLSDIQAAHSISIRVYDHQGYHIPAPGEKSARPDERVIAIISKIKPVIQSEIRGRTYATVIPLFLRGECKLCHMRWNKREVVGAVSFERAYDAAVYYSSERIIIFICITIVLGGLLYAVFRWDPGKNIKELFDK